MFVQRHPQNGDAPPDLICVSHLRWDSVFQRPHHLMTRFAEERRVFFIEEPLLGSGGPMIETRRPMPGLTVAVPRIPAGSTERERSEMLADLTAELIEQHGIGRFVLWMYSPMAVEWTRHLRPVATVYDCMDELSAFVGAPATLPDREGELLDSADVVFTGGRSLYEAKRHRHPRVRLTPSAVDAEHFASARSGADDPADQATIPHPRVGFFGVIDERLDIELMSDVAERRPDLQLVMIGPVVKIDPARLPTGDNVHYLGQKTYAELPRYVSGWDVAMLPFARNDATRYISPTKTPEYLAAGRPVVSTPIEDVVEPYGERGYVEIAATGEGFVAAIERLLASGPRAGWADIDGFLATISWDETWARMRDDIDDVVRSRVHADRSRPVGLREHDPVPLPTAGTGAELPPSVSVGDPRGFDWLIVGAGFAGAVLAERLAADAGARVLVVERRNHIGGNAYDHYDDAGILVHRYGPHIFHTNAQHVFEYLSAFTRWRPYQHRVLASVDGKLVPMPINAETINRLYGMHLDRFEVEAFLERIREPVENPRTSEDVVVSSVGRELYEKFFRNYTRKQWGLDPSELDAGVAARVAARTSLDDRYFTDTYQSMPLHGYTRMFERILDHPNIKVMLNTDYREVVGLVPFAEMIYTGPIDGYFDHRFGKLPYRSLRFEFETWDEPVHQPAAVINHPNEYAYTRVTEFKYLTGQQHPRTSLVYEYPRDEGDPYYPVPRRENTELYQRYRALAERTPGVHFVGRLATYKYYNMDQVVAQALAVYRRLGVPSHVQEKESADGLDDAIVSRDRDMGRDRMHAQPGRRSLLRPA